MIDKNQKYTPRFSFVIIIIHAFKLYYYSCVSYHINYALHKNDISMISQTTNKLSKDRKCSTFGIIASFFSFCFILAECPNSLILKYYLSCIRLVYFVFDVSCFLIFNIFLSELRILDLRHEKRFTHYIMFIFKPRHVIRLQHFSCMIVDAPDVRESLPPPSPSVKGGRELLV